MFFPAITLYCFSLRCVTPGKEEKNFFSAHFSLKLIKSFLLLASAQAKVEPVSGTVQEQGRILREKSFSYAYK